MHYSFLSAVHSVVQYIVAFTAQYDRQRIVVIFNYLAVITYGLVLVVVVLFFNSLHFDVLSYGA